MARTPERRGKRAELSEDTSPARGEVFHSSRARMERSLLISTPFSLRADEAASQTRAESMGDSLSIPVSPQSSDTDGVNGSPLPVAGGDKLVYNLFDKIDEQPGLPQLQAKRRRIPKGARSPVPFPVSRLRYGLRSQTAGFPLQQLPSEIRLAIFKFLIPWGIDSHPDIVAAVRSNAVLYAEASEVLWSNTCFVFKALEGWSMADLNQYPLKAERLTYAQFPVLCRHDDDFTHPQGFVCNRPPPFKPSINIPVLSALRRLHLDVRCGYCLRRFLASCHWAGMPRLQVLAITFSSAIQTRDQRIIDYAVDRINAAVGVPAYLDRVMDLRGSNPLTYIWISLPYGTLNFDQTIITQAYHAYAMAG